MKAIRIHEHGDSSILKVEDIPEPIPQKNEVKIRIKASSLNHMDLWVRNGIPGIGKLPLILGCDGSGVVVDCGSKVTGFSEGDRVCLFPVLSCGKCDACEAGLQNHCKEMQLFGEHVNGTHCEFICVPHENVFKIDDKLSFEKAAAFPLVFLTAWHMLVYNGQVKEGDVVLILGSGSGVGSSAIQIAKAKGATVITTAGTDEKLDHAKKLGADYVINHYKDSISKSVKEMTQGKGAHLIIEHVGEKVWAECLKALSWNGSLITCGATTGPQVSMDLRHIFIKQQKIIGSTMGSFDDMKALYNLIIQDKLQPIISKTFPYTDVQKAHDYLENSEQFGKVILVW